MNNFHMKISRFTVCINQSTIHSNKELHADSIDPAQVAPHLAMHEYV